MTQEAFELYASRLKPDGVLAIHITNRFLDLKPVLASSADTAGLSSRVVVHHVERDDDVCFDTQWILHHRLESQIAGQRVRTIGEPLEMDAGFRTWTDGFSNLLSVLM